MTELLWLAVENLCRLLGEWAGRRHDLYVQPRYFPQVVEEAWDHPIPRRERTRRYHG